MSRTEAMLSQYRHYYHTFYEHAFEAAFVGRTTRDAAEELAQAQSHYMAQRLMCQSDLYYLATQVFDMENAKDHTTGRKIWYEPIHAQVCDELQANRDSLIHVSRNTLKSTIFKMEVVRQILLDPANVAIGMWSRSAPRVQIELKSIKGMLQNRKLLELFPDRLIPNDRKWAVNNREALTITRAVPDEEGHVREIPLDEAQVEVWGLESTVIGRHYTHFFWDDPIDRGNTTTATMIEKTHDQWASIQAMRTPHSREKMIGTPWHQLDLYATAEKESFFDKKLVIPGVLADGTIVYPYFTHEFLDRQRRKLGDYLYSCQYVLDTRPKSQRMFVLPVPYWTELPDDPVFYIAVDPSTGKHERTDKTGIAVACVSRSNPNALFYLEADSFRLRPEEIADEVIKRVLRYSPERIGIEFGLQEALGPLIQLKADEKQVRLPRFLDIKTGGGAGALSKADKIDRTLGAMVRDQKAFFRPEMDRLFRQMASFNPNVQKNEDDVLDAASMVIQTVPYFHQSHWQDVEEKTPVGGFTVEFFRRKVRGDKRTRIFAA